jgi:hypothetical protein
MKIVRVQYTTKPEFAQVNQANIAAIVSELKELNHAGIKYGCWLQMCEAGRYDSKKAHRRAFLPNALNDCLLNRNLPVDAFCVFFLSHVYF